jgi:hypothetical protein
VKPYPGPPATLGSTATAGARIVVWQALAGEINEVADSARSGVVAYPDVEQGLATLRSLGKFAPDPLVFAIAQVFGSEP